MKQYNADILVRAILLGTIIALLGISARPRQVDRIFTQALKSLASGNSRHAATNIGEAAEYLPWWKNLWLVAGQYAAQAGDFEAVIHYFTQYGPVQDLSDEDKLLLGDAYRQSGNLAQAEQIWQLAVNGSETSLETHVRLANLHRLQENVPALIDDLRSILALQPNNAQIAFELGLLLSTQEPESALSYLEVAAQQEPKYKESALDLQRKINTAQLAQEPAYTFLEAGRALASMEEWELAFQAFQQAIRKRADYAEAWAFLGEARQHMASFVTSTESEPMGLKELETALELNPGSVAANVLMGIYWQRQNQYDRALVYIRTASNLNPDNPMLQTEVGRVLARTGDLDGAQKKYERAIELAPQDPTYWRLLAEFSLHYQLQVHQIALPAARQTVILSSGDAQSLDVMAQTLIILGDNLNAERYLWRALEEDGEYVPAHLHLGIVYMNRGESRLARQQFDLAKDIAPDDWTFEQAQRLIGYYFP